MIKKLFISTLAVVMSGIVSFAATSQKLEHYALITGIVVKNDFHVSVHSGVEYSADMSIDSRLADYTRMFLQGSTLVIEVNEKDFPKELKAQLRKKEATMTAQVVVTLPLTASLQNIELYDNATLTFSGKFENFQSIQIVADGNSTLKSLHCKATKADITAKKKALVHANIEASNINLVTSNSAEAHYNIDCTSLNTTFEGQSNTAVSGTAKVATISTSNSAKVELAGTYPKLTVSGKGNSSVDASTVSADEVSVDLNSSSCDIKANKKLKIQLTSGAKLVYGGSAVIDIDKIQNSSVTRSGSTKRK